MKKFSDIINDTINQEELSHVFGGVSADAQQTDRACGSKRIGEMNECFPNIMKVYGSDHWDFPDPRCDKAPRNISEKIYV